MMKIINSTMLPSEIVTNDRDLTPLPSSSFCRNEEEREWIGRILAGCKRMATDEAYRKKIAKNLS